MVFLKFRVFLGILRIGIKILLIIIIKMLFDFYYVALKYFEEGIEMIKKDIILIKLIDLKF